ncbi:MAG: glycoside hydrolase family 95 protein [Planctomycetaceae bacterium]|nr:glycoside hydrolase family 95 protein [Planctomycetaceae bacterium]
MVFTDLATVWDEGIPLGNAIIGALVWQKGDSLRMSLDHVGLWDLRPMVNRDLLPVHNFQWVQEQVAKKDYRPVQQMYDVPYETSAFPTKLPGGALEFDTTELGKVDTVRLFLNNALCEVQWTDGARLQAFVHATENKGWFLFENVTGDFMPVLVTPNYRSSQAGDDNSHAGPELSRLGYVQGEVLRNGNTIVYHQPGSGGFYYEIAVSWHHTGQSMEGVWTILPKPEGDAQAVNIAEIVETALQQGFSQSYHTHNLWWKNYWAQSSVNIPDPVLAKQYYNEMYKFGSAARSYSPPVSLQAVWTADNGKLPPWKGDYHHDLNTQLSYWPCYAGNRLEEGLGYLNWLWETLPVNKRYTLDYFGVDGLAVPGVTTLKGEPMAGWIQYSFGPTVSAWLAQHFYLHWQYSQDRDFLKNRAYPYMKEVAVFLDNISVRDAEGKRKLPISSSPEIYNNTLEAWFHTTTNYDLGLIRFVFTAAEELASGLGLQDEAARWKTILSEWPDVDLDDENALTFARGFPYNESHRHFSNIMAFHPLGLIDWSYGERDRDIIAATIKKLEEYGPDWWCGYSYSWLGNVKARAMDGEGAAEALTIFAEHFCLRNTFHANGDQANQGYSKFTYRPFTLEGNMAFASGIHEMLIQSHTGTIRVFPAVPASWDNVSFEKLRAVGAFLVSARMENRNVSLLTVESEKGGTLRLMKPSSGHYVEASGKTLNETDGVWTVEMEPGEVLMLVLEHQTNLE